MIQIDGGTQKCMTGVWRWTISGIALRFQRSAAFFSLKIHIHSSLGDAFFAH